MPALSATDACGDYVVRRVGRVLTRRDRGFIVEPTASEVENQYIRDRLAAARRMLEVVRSGALGIGEMPQPPGVVRVVSV